MPPGTDSEPQSRLIRVAIQPASSQPETTQLGGIRIGQAIRHFLFPDSLIRTVRTVPGINIVARLDQSGSRPKMIMSQLSDRCDHRGPIGLAERHQIAGHDTCNHEANVVMELLVCQQGSVLGRPPGDLGAAGGRGSI